MRHKCDNRKLGRTSSHRKALLKNLTISLIEHGKIETTVHKAKELRSYVEKLITKVENANSNDHKYAFSVLQHKTSVKKLLSEVAPKYKDRKGGYTRIVRVGRRRGDAAEMAYIELV